MASLGTALHGHGTAPFLIQSSSFSVTYTDFSFLYGLLYVLQQILSYIHHSFTFHPFLGTFDGKAYTDWWQEGGSFAVAEPICLCGALATDQLCRRACDVAQR